MSFNRMSYDSWKTAGPWDDAIDCTCECGEEFMKLPGDDGDLCQECEAKLEADDE